MPAERLEFRGPKPFEEVDFDEIHEVLDLLEESAPRRLRQDESQAMLFAVASMLKEDDLRAALAKNPAMSLLLDRDHFIPEKSAGLITSSDRARRIIFSDTRFRQAFEAESEHGPRTTEGDNRVILTMWAIFFEAYHIIVGSRRSSDKAVYN